MTILSLFHCSLFLFKHQLDSPSVCHLKGKMWTSGICLILLLNAGCVAAQADSNLCYILDAILIIYGIVLTVLYCRLRMRPTNANNTEKQGGGIYEGLQRPHQDTYDTLHGLKKKPLA
ncbi:Fc receptor, IgE, high affinity I, gamma polypeptide like isoform X2 [Myxocyprinus asiaticus]|uniref:Fc receptor, IgE, high affinity I, gamma polypeptide like isoform X2 n=1 Tax=Myxocyprinus asiaticus TaxID=70543 RepID=UPI002221B191|nr:Fc receptor, IgE, high affinity I, gamma polypeptide like isoform X2 [Myxocyprinus asiaticus]